MYLEHFGLNEAPFRITPHTDFFFGGANRGATLDALVYAVTHDEGIVKISGEVGSGKTMLCRVLIERLPKKVTIVYLGNPSLSREDILYAIADELKLAVPDHSRNATILRLLQEHLIKSFSEGQRVIVLIDEAHAMPAETLEEIRLLSNLEFHQRKLLQLVLFGQPELNDILSRPEMRQLKERITHNFWLEPLVRDDIASYLDFRMRAAGYRGPSVFTPTAIRMIAQASLGLTRRINVIADKALIAAFSTNSHQISASEVHTAIRDCEFSDATYSNEASRKQSRLRLTGLLVLLISSVLGLYHLGNQRLQAPASPNPIPIPESKPLAEAVTIESTAAAQPPSTPPSKTPPATEAPPAVQDELGLGPLTRQRLDAGSAWLKRASDESWFLQMSIREINQKDQIEQLLNKATAKNIDLNDVHVFYSTLSGSPRLGVIYGEYPTKEAAQSAARKLPPLFKSPYPYPRQVVRLR